MSGQIHIYTGDGKGKTTAAMGLAVRFAGHGGKVLIGQFLKDGSSGELGVLKSIPGITVHSCEQHFGFAFRMTDEVKCQAAECYNRYLDCLFEEAVHLGAGLLILDEVIGACGHNLICQDKLIVYLKQKPEEMEVVLTGRNPSDELFALADYVSNVEKQKHPFDAGIVAREGIEW